MAKDILSVAVEFTGRARIAAFYHYIFDPSDPFPAGYTLSDIWPIA